MKLTSSVIEGFVGSVLASNFDGAVPSPDFHKECWEMCVEPTRQVAIAAPRKHAKTSALTIGYGLATLLFRERKYMIIVSDTVSQSEQFLGEMKQHLQTNQDLIDLFSLRLNEKGEVAFIKDTSDDVIVEMADGHKFRIQAKGAEQKLRGLIWNGSRPDIIIGDDMENDELVMNKERREKMRRWFYGALLPCLSHTGVIRVFGTILHMDSLLESFMPERQIQTARKDKKINFLDIQDLSTRVRKGTVRTPWKSIRYKAHNSDFSSILWPDMYSQNWFEDRYADFASQGITDVYSQEFLNTPLDEGNTYFHRHDFQKRTEKDRQKPLNYYVTCDLAISQDTRADYSVFLVAGVDENKVIHVINVIRDRMDGREIVDTLINLQRMYEPQCVGIEEMQISKSIGPFLNEEMIKSGTYLSLVKLKHGGKDKLFRARSIQARMRVGAVKFEKESDWYQDFEEECMRFPRDKHDDQVDTFAYLGLMLDKLLEAPTAKEIEEDEYEEEYAESGLSDAGRNEHTGY